jgi:hypothetical protein
MFLAKFLEKKVRPVGFVLAACLLAGCQTAPMGNREFSFAGLDVAHYGMDRAESARRAPAGGGIKFLRDVLEAFRGVTRVKGAIVKMDQKFLNFMRDSRDPEVLSVLGSKDKNAALTAKDFDELSEKTTVRLARDFIESEKLRDYPAVKKFIRENEELRSAIAKTDPLGNKGATTAAEKAEIAKLNKKMPQSGAKGAIAENAVESGTKNGIESWIADPAHDLTELFEEMEKTEGGRKLSAALKGMIERDPEVSAETISGLMEESLIIFSYGKFSNLLPETCENLDSKAAGKYLELLHDIRMALEEDALVKYVRGEGRKLEAIPCKNIAEISAWAVDEFQRGLGRVGEAARIAREEMGPSACSYIAGMVARAPASEVKPKCVPL